MEVQYLQETVRPWLQCLYWLHCPLYQFCWHPLTIKLYIRPSEETPCPSEQCYLLTHVLQNAVEYFTSNTTVVLTPGHSVVNKNILAEIKDVSNLTLMGSHSGSTVIECSEYFHLNFSNVVYRSCYIKPQLLQLFCCSGSNKLHYDFDQHQLHKRF